MEVVALQKIDSIDLVNYILYKYGPMSHLKLQKLLFYCDAYHLAYFDAELVNDKFEAWVHGPVSKKVFDFLKDKSLLYADLHFSGDAEHTMSSYLKLTTDQRDLIDDVLSVLSLWSGMQLETATHREKPWQEMRVDLGIGDKCNREISKETTKVFYKTELGLI